MFIVTSDLHLTDKPRDAYRFGLFLWLAQRVKKLDVEAVFILGDLTDAKDKHSAVLVNNLINGLRLVTDYCPVFILKGNHDYIDPNNPFFGFLDSIPDVWFFTTPFTVEKFNVRLIPHQPNQAALDTAFSKAPDGGLVFMHQTLTGAISETGVPLKGLSLPPNKAGAIYSGDVHVPQVCHGIVYVGSPFHVHFGDKFNPRVVLLDTKGYTRHSDLHFDAPKKYSLTIRDVDELSHVKAGDQVKLVIELTRAEVVEWQQHKQRVMGYCQSHGIEVYGCEIKTQAQHKRVASNNKPASKGRLEYFKEYCNAENLSGVVREVGLNFIGGAK